MSSSFQLRRYEHIAAIDLYAAALSRYNEEIGAGNDAIAIIPGTKGMNLEQKLNLLAGLGLVDFNWLRNVDSSVGTNLLTVQQHSARSRGYIRISIRGHPSREVSLDDDLLNRFHAAYSMSGCGTPKSGR